MAKQWILLFSDFLLNFGFSRETLDEKSSRRKVRCGLLSLIDGVDTNAHCVSIVLYQPENNEPCNETMRYFSLRFRNAWFFDLILWPVGFRKRRFASR